MCLSTVVLLSMDWGNECGKLRCNHSSFMIEISQHSSLWVSYDAPGVRDGPNERCNAVRNAAILLSGVSKGHLLRDIG